MPFLAVHDVDAIQSYIFASNRLREIRGASALIDELNTVETPRLAGGNVVFAGGGAVMAEFEAENAAREFLRQVANLYVQRTVSASSTGAVAEYDGSAPDRASASIDQLFRALRQRKDGRVRRTQLPASPYFQRCRACGLRPASGYDRRAHPGGPEPRAICDACRLKWEAAKGTPSIHQEIERQHSGQVRFQDGEIDDLADGDGFIALIHADANRMGERLKAVSAHGLEALQHFSGAVHRATRAAAETAVPLAARDNGGRLKAFVAVCGGDDVTLITAGAGAPVVALEYLRTFAARLAADLEGDSQLAAAAGRPSACAGIAIAKSHTPLSLLFELAHDLCRSAKERAFHEFRTSGGEVSCIDFHVATSPAWGDIGVIRREFYRVPGAGEPKATARPYTVEEAERLLEAAALLREARFPPGKLHRLYDSIFEGRQAAVLRYLSLYTRTARGGPKQLEALHRLEELLEFDPSAPPWRLPAGPGQEVLATPMADLLEIMGFTSQPAGGAP